MILQMKYIKRYTYRALQWYFNVYHYQKWYLATLMRRTSYRAIYVSYMSHDCCQITYQNIVSFIGLTYQNIVSFIGNIVSFIGITYQNIVSFIGLLCDMTYMLVYIAALHICQQCKATCTWYHTQLQVSFAKEPYERDYILKDHTCGNNVIVDGFINDPHIYAFTKILALQQHGNTHYRRVAMYEWLTCCFSS